MIRIRVAHVSDLHFGRKHRFLSDLTAEGGRAPERQIQTLADSIRRDLGEPPSGTEQLLVVSGDLTETAADEEFRDARAFIGALQPSCPAGTHIVPGNHDVVYTEKDAGKRWYPYCQFYNWVFGQLHDPEKSDTAFSKLHVDERRSLAVLELNSCFDVQAGTVEATRGYIQERALQKVEKELGETKNLEGMIRIAIVHHHPVLVPQLVDGGAGYDAIAQSHKLLQLLQKFGFHVVLHGHKHNPVTFSYDATSLWTTTPQHGFQIVAGGSAGSTEIDHAKTPRATNTYNVIDIAWDPKTRDGRIRIETRGLVRTDEHGAEIPSRSNWTWTICRVVEERMRRELGAVKQGGLRPRGPSDAAALQARDAEYKRLKYNLPTVEVIPSLEPGQDFECILRLVAHPKNHGLHRAPTRVVWRPGFSFEDVIDSPPGESHDYAATFAYYGPMLVQAELLFSEDDGGGSEFAYIYAPFPPSWPEKAKPPA